MLGTSLVAIQPGTSAAAVSGSDFNPGAIISDALFYDNAAMTQAEIQSFLNARIGSCSNGKCLNVLTTTVASRAAVSSMTTGNQVCSAFAGGTLSAAAIIYRAQVACNISAKVILVTLQKEQSLVTDRAPSDSTLARAMGMACPDTAPCAEYALGFGNQIYEGAKQLHFYKAGNFAKQPGVQFIGYHPDTSCGGAVINITNYATAALYNYTPYQPNAASLANFGGVGNSCSSYGNRNFFAYYNNWFGSTGGAPASSPDFGASVYARDSAGDLWAYPSDDRGGWADRKKLGSGWSGMTSVFGAGDFDGDGHRDVLAIDAAGVLWNYPMDGNRGFLAPKQVSTGWSDQNLVFSAGDFNGDGTQDLMSRDASGGLWLHSSDGEGQLDPAVRVGWGWQGMTVITGVGDFTADGKPDVMAETAGAG